MANGTGQLRTPDELVVIGEIHCIENELRSLGVRLTSAKLISMTTGQLNDYLESVAEQLQARKRWLGGKQDGKN